MSIYAYKITRDYGFAPNPFGPYCTLACCKPHIRKKAVVGDWIIGTGAVKNGLLNHLLFFMQVTERITFQEYWEDKRFSYKKPLLNGSLKQIHGDNIYYHQNNQWHQVDSHHSFHEGVINEGNLEQDLSGEYVLVSDCFIYLGDQNIRVPDKYIDICPTKKHRDYITVRNEELGAEFIELILSNYGFGFKGNPINWKEYKQLQLI